ncbi:MAG: DUF6152 family protein [Candidatus Rariloculaceae bacterium]
MQYRLLIASIALLTLSSGGRLHAHHGAAAHFDPNDVVTLNGVITELQFVNPHSFVHIDVSDPNGEVTSWRCELSGTSQLLRRGWTPETLAPGQSIELVGERARREANSCAMLTIAFTDGKVIEAGEAIEGAAIPQAVASSEVAARRSKYLANGQPNFAGSWVAQTGNATGGAVTNGAPVPTAAGVAASERFDFRFDNPVIRCESGNIIADWYRQSHVNEIEQDDNRITLRYGYLDLVRTIHLDVVEHPDIAVPSVVGHSIGHWDGDVLVVDTLGFQELALHPRQEIMLSSQARIEERFFYDDATRTLVRDYTIFDPQYLEQPYSGRNVADIAARPYQPFECVDLSGENKRRPVE